ncbi:MAG: ORF6N domain-containing protein [Paludibacteraceae bacterium]
MTTTTNIATIESDVQNRIITLRQQHVLLDADVAILYGVGTREINQAVKNNPEKFPEGYIITLNDKEKDEVVKNFDHLDKLKYSAALPKAFTEKGLYMLATILKSPKAVQTTIAIVETFAQMRELTRTLNQLQKTDDKAQQKSLMQRSSELLSDIVGDGLDTSSTETEIEVNFAVFKIKHKIKRS